MGEAKRRRRIYINQRDIAALKWIGEQQAIRFDHLQHLLGRMSPRTPQVPGVISIHTVRQVVERWEADGLVVVRKYSFGEPHWVWLTSRGLQQMDLPYSYREPSLSKRNHYHAVNGVRLTLEAKWQDDFEWISERALVREQGQQVAQGEQAAAIHIPDAEALLCDHDEGDEDEEDEEDGGQVYVRYAVEVELTQKSRKRLDSILAQLNADSRYESIAYFVAESCYASVKQALIDIQKGARKKKFSLYRLAEYLP